MNARAFVFTFALALAFGVVRGAAAASTMQPLVQEPRDFGYLIGDIVTQRILLPTAGRDAVAPPSIGRASVWLDRRRVHIDDDAEGRRWMTIEYQVVNVAPTLTRIALPELTLKSASGATLHVAPWPISVGPITSMTATPANALDGSAAPMRPDRLAPPRPTAPLRRDARVAFALLLATLLAWAAWWAARNARESARLPFARAWRRIRALDPAKSADAWIVVHRAIDETAGHVVHTASLPELLARVPYLQPLRAQLEQFYRASSERFFAPEAALSSASMSSANEAQAAQAAQAAPPTAVPDWLRALSRDLCRAERRHRR